MKKRKDRNYGKEIKGRGERISVQANQLKLSKKLFFMFVFQFLLYEEKYLFEFLYLSFF